MFSLFNIILQVIFKSVTALKIIISLPPASNFQNIWTVNYILIWSGLITLLECATANMHAGIHIRKYL